MTGVLGEAVSCRTCLRGQYSSCARTPLCSSCIACAVGSEPTTTVPLLPSVRDDQVTCLRTGAALARLPCRLWTRWTIRVIVSHATRENSQTCRRRAVIGRQPLSLRSSRQWARTAQLSSARARVTDRAPTTNVWALRDDAGPQNDADGRGRRSGRFRDGSKRHGSSEQRGRRTSCPSTPPLSRPSSRPANSPSAKSPTPTRKHSALLVVLRLLLRSWWLLLLYVHPPSVLTPVGYFPLVPAVSPFH